MKTLINHCEKHNLNLHLITYTGHGLKKRGYDITDKNGFIIAQFEPTNYRKESIYYSEKWKVTGKKLDRPVYIKRITKSFLESLGTEPTNDKLI